MRVNSRPSQQLSIYDNRVRTQKIVLQEMAWWFNPLYLKSAAPGRYINTLFASWFDLFQRCSLEDTFEPHLTGRVNILAMHCGYLWPPVLFKFTKFHAFFQSALFFELAKWRRLVGIIWLQRTSSKVFAIQAVSRIEYVTLVDVSFRRSLL